MDDEFVYNAPQYYDFPSEKSSFEEEPPQQVETYFEVDHEMQAEEYFYSPHPFPAPDEPKQNMRKSMSMGNLTEPKNDAQVQNLYQALNTMNLKSNNSSLKNSTKSLNKMASTEHLNKLAQPKDPNPTKYVSLAEAVNKFQHGTPQRFRSKSQQHLHQLKPTIPQSPVLISKLRSRPTTAIPFEQKMLMDFKEAQKFKIKANAVNQKILRGPMKAEPLPKKQTTVVEPFNLTQVEKKVVPLVQEVSRFKAKPAPKVQHQVAAPLKRYPSKEFPKKLTRTSSDGAMVKKSVPLTKTIPQPFSFDNWYDTMQKKRQERIQKELQEEKNARKFTARPLPKFIEKEVQNKSETRSVKSETDEQIYVPFKARPPTSILKEPFIPKKSDRPLTEISGFELNTAKRAVDRNEFALKIQKFEELKDQKRREEEEKQKQEEEEEILKLRKELEFKAHPIRKFKELRIKPANEVTIPKSPFSRKYSHPNKENSNEN